MLGKKKPLETVDSILQDLSAKVSKLKDVAQVHEAEVQANEILIADLQQENSVHQAEAERAKSVVSNFNALLGIK